MTTIITRLYQDEATANGVAQALLDAKFRPGMLDVIGPGGDTGAALAAAGAPKAAMEAAAAGINAGHALLVVRGAFGGAEKAGMIVDTTPAVSPSDANGSIYVRTDMSAQYSNNILSDHPRFMSSGMFPALSRGRSTIAAFFGKPLLRKKVNLRTSLYQGTKYWANFPIPHLGKNKRNINNSIYRGTKYWANWPIGHLTSRERDPSLI